MFEKSFDFEKAYSEYNKKIVPHTESEYRKYTDLVLSVTSRLIALVIEAITAKLTLGRDLEAGEAPLPKLVEVKTKKSGRLIGWYVGVSNWLCIVHLLTTEGQLVECHKGIFAEKYFSRAIPLSLPVEIQAGSKQYYAASFILGDLCKFAIDNDLIKAKVLKKFAKEAGVEVIIGNNVFVMTAMDQSSE